MTFVVCGRAIHHPGSWLVGVGGTGGQTVSLSYLMPSPGIGQNSIQPAEY